MKCKTLFLILAISFLNPSHAFEANIKMVNFNSDERSKILNAVKAIKKVINSYEFKRRILEHSYQGEKKFLDNLGQSNEQIFKTILEGAEELTPEKNGHMDIELELMESNGRTVGHTYRETKRIWINRKFFVRFTAAEIANNLFHEWMHKLGYDHANEFSHERNYSVPYAIGNIVGEIAKSYEAELALD